MRGPILSVSLLIGITFAATDAVAAEVTGGEIDCNPPNGLSITFSGTWEWYLYEGLGYKVVGCYMPVYGASSPSTYYTPYNDSSSGTESVNVPIVDYDYSLDPPELSHLDGAIVWFEYGSWSGGNWSRSGDVTEWFWIPCNVGSCFAPGTPVLTPEGSKPIEQFKVGDWILSSPRNDAKVLADAHQVTKVVRSRGQLMEIAVSGQIVQATREHPLYVKDKGWTRTASLAPGDLLRSRDDQWMPIDSITDAAESIVYNVCVEENGTYFIGGHDWGFSLWVDGSCIRRETPVGKIAQSKRVSSRFRTAESAFEHLALDIADGSLPRMDLPRPFHNVRPTVLDGQMNWHSHMILRRRSINAHSPLIEISTRQSGVPK